MHPGGLLALAFVSVVGAQDLRDMASPPPEKARIVFIRADQAIGANIPTDVVEIAGGKPMFVARIWPAQKYIHETSAGSKNFLTLGGYRALTTTPTGNPLLANVTEGKTYYVVLRYHPGTGGIIPNAVRPRNKFDDLSSVVTEGIEKYRVVTTTPEDADAFKRERRERDIVKEYNRVRGLLLRKRPDEQDERILRPEDAIR